MVLIFPLTPTYLSKMLFANPLLDTEKTTLINAQKYHPLSSTRTRAHCILLSAQHYKIQEIVDICNVCRQSVSNTIHAWESQGLAGLMDKPRSGRPKILTSEQEEAILEKVEESPRSLKKVLSEFLQAHDVKIALQTIKNICKKAGLRWKRARKSLRKKRNQEEYDRSKTLVNELLNSCESGEIELYYFDESGFNLTPNVPYAWQPTGEHIEIPSSKSPSFNVLGFMNKACQFESFVFKGSITTDIVIKCFEKMQQKIIKPSFVLVDNASIHTSHKFDQATIEWAKNGLLVVPISRYSPELNLIEILWRKIKYEWMPFSAYESINSLQEALFDILSKIGTQFKVDFC